MLKSFGIPLCVQEVGQGLQVWILMVGGEYLHPIVLIRVSPTYVWPWSMLQRSYEQNKIKPTPLKRFQPADSYPWTKALDSNLSESVKSSKES